MLICEGYQLGQGERLISPIDRQRGLIHYRLEEIFPEAEYNAQWNARGHMADADLESNASFEPALITVIPFMAPNLIERVDMNLIENNSDREILAFDGHPMEISHRYDMRGIAKNKDGADVARVTITGINHVPTARLNMFSATYAVTNGWTFFGDSTGVTMNKGSSSMKFDLLIPTGSGFLYAIRIVPESDQDVAAVAVEKATVNEQSEGTQKQNNDRSEDQTVDIAPKERNRTDTVTLPNLTRQLVHYRMCHVNQRDAEKVAKYFGYGLYKPRNINATALSLAENVQHIVMCEACQISRTKRHGVKKQSDHIPSTQPNGRVFVDI